MDFNKGKKAIEQMNCLDQLTVIACSSFYFWNVQVNPDTF